MKVIEGYIQRKPIFLEWLHGQLLIDDVGTPTGFSDRFYSSHIDTVKVWLLTMHAICGDMCLQGVDHLNLASLRNVNFPPQFSDSFTLSNLWLPDRFSGYVPDAKVCWVYTSSLDLVDPVKFTCSEWVCVLDGPPSRMMRSKDLSHIRGVDASAVSLDVWREWCAVLKDAPIRYCTLPRGLSEWEGTPDWSATLKVLKIPPNVELFINEGWYYLCRNVEVLCLRHERRTLVRNTDRDGLWKIPEALMQMQHLRWLDVSMNPIQQMPETIHTLHRLETLYLAHTELDEFPSVLLQLTSLKRLFIRNTNATSTRKWLNLLSRQNTELSIHRVVSQDPITLWELCLITEC